MKSLILAITLLLATNLTLAQNSIEDYVTEGIQHHDSGNYDKAIKSYNKALKIDPLSSLVNYEISLSYFSKGDYKEAIKHSDLVLKINKDHVLQAYLTKGSALDMLGKTDESIKLFEKALKKEEKHYLVYYNLGINYFKLNNLDKAEENVIKAIEVNNNHTSSHLMLAKINNLKGNSVQALLASHYFLFLEPNTKRSVEAFKILQNNFAGNVSNDSKKPNTINIMLSPNDDDQFSAASLMISMLAVRSSLEENEGKTDDEMFIKNTESFFKFMGELNKKKNKEIWWKLYTPFFYDLAQSEHIDTYCNYIRLSTYDNAKDWFAANESKLSKFDAWLKGE